MPDLIKAIYDFALFHFKLRATKSAPEESPAKNK